MTSYPESLCLWYLIWTTRIIHHSICNLILYDVWLVYICQIRCNVIFDDVNTRGNLNKCS